MKSSFNMVLQLMLNCLVGFLNIQAVSTVNRTYLKRYYTLPDFRVSGNWSNYNGVENAQRCCLECNKQINCTAVNFRKELNICELVEPGGLISPDTSSGWMFYYSSSLQINPLFSATATQSSTSWGGVAGLAIDGGKSSNFHHGTCTHAFYADYPWWMVDLKAYFQVHSVLIWNRLDCCYNRLADLIISVSPSLYDIDDGDNICATYTGPPNPPTENPVTIHCTREMRGRYLKILRQINNSVLTLCEVEFLVA